MRKFLRGLFISAFLAIAGSSALMPLGQLRSWMEFRFFPQYAKLRHFVRLHSRDGATTLYVLGTVHDAHFAKESDYPYWQVRSAIEEISPDLLLVEIRPASLQKDQWGEGPAEMSYAISVARRPQLEIGGIDYWTADYRAYKDFSEREDHMAVLTEQQALNHKVVLVLTGFSHVVGLKRRLRAAGYEVDKTFSDEEKQKDLGRGEDAKIPHDFFEAANRVLGQIDRGESDYDEDWAHRRRALLESLQSSP